MEWFTILGLGNQKVHQNIVKNYKQQFRVYSIILHLLLDIHLLTLSNSIKLKGYTVEENSDHTAKWYPLFNKNKYRLLDFSLMSLFLFDHTIHNEQF